VGGGRSHHLISTINILSGIDELNYLVRVHLSIDLVGNITHVVSKLMYSQEISFFRLQLLE